MKNRKESLNDFLLVLAVAAALAGLLGPALAAPYDRNPGSRSAALGGAFCALAGDLDALIYNPAGLASLSGQQLQGGYLSRPDLLMLHSGQVAYGMPLTLGRTAGALGGSLSYNGASLEQGGDGLRSWYHEAAFTLGLATRITKAWHIGLSLNRYMIDSSAGNGAGIGLDAGTLLRPFEFLQLGLAASNLAADMKNEGIDPAFRAGLALLFLEDALIISGQAEARTGLNGSAGWSILPAAGAEYTFRKLIAVRAGFDRRFVTAGLGFAYRGIRLDYAFLGDAESVMGHRVTLGYVF